MRCEKESMKYLGVTITKDITKLFEASYTPLNAKIKSDVSRWNLISFSSFSSRIESVKMVILPRLLYLFQSLPCEIPEQQFMEWDKLISRYIWMGKNLELNIK